MEEQIIKSIIDYLLTPKGLGNYLSVIKSNPNSVFEKLIHGNINGFSVKDEKNGVEQDYDNIDETKMLRDHFKEELNIFKEKFIDVSYKELVLYDLALDMGVSNPNQILSYFGKIVFPKETFINPIIEFINNSILLLGYNKLLFESTEDYVNRIKDSDKKIELDQEYIIDLITILKS